MSNNGTKSTTDQKEIRASLEEMNNHIKGFMAVKTVIVPAPAKTPAPAPKQI